MEVKKHEDEACEALTADGPLQAWGHAAEAVEPVDHSERAQEVELWPARASEEKATLEDEVLLQTECEKAGLLKQSVVEGWGWWAQMETLVKGVALHLTLGAQTQWWNAVQGAKCPSGTGLQEGAGPGGLAVALTNPSRSRCHAGLECWEMSYGCPGQCPWGRCPRRLRCGHPSFLPRPLPHILRVSQADSTPESLTS